MREALGGAQLQGALSSDKPATAPASSPPGSLGSRARMGKGHPRVPGTQRSWFHRSFAACPSRRGKGKGTALIPGSGGPSPQSACLPGWSGHFSRTAPHAQGGWRCLSWAESPVITPCQGRAPLALMIHYRRPSLSQVRSSKELHESVADEGGDGGQAVSLSWEPGPYQAACS